MQRLGAGLLAAAFGLWGQAAELPYAEFAGPSFSVHELAERMPGGCEQGARPRFGDLSYPLGEDEPGSDGRVALSGGRMSRSEGAAGERLGNLTVRLASAHDLPGGGGRTRFWLVVLHVESVGGSTSTNYQAQVMRCRAGVLEEVQRVVWEARVPEGRAAPVVAGDGGLRFTTSHYLPGDAHCCVSAVDEVSLRWEGRRYGKARVRSRRIRGGETP
ncbi:MAG: hypothetical protein J0L64_03440 [Acidobacteria bacterium]|nr:hypothetical protein [Acidobacteriota bacterium]